MHVDKAFIDSNILIYAYTTDEPDKQKIALKFLDDCQPVISTQVIREFSNVLLKKGNVRSEWIKQEIGEIIEIAILLNEDLSLILDSFTIHERYKYSFYDSLIITTALNSQCQVLLSEDMQDGQIIEGRLRIVNPFH